MPQVPQAWSLLENHLWMHGKLNPNLIAKSAYEILEEITPLSITKQSQCSLLMKDIFCSITIIAVLRLLEISFNLSAI